MCLFVKKRRSPVWTENTHFLASSDFICSECRFKTDEPRDFCPRCGAGPMKTEYADPVMHEWLEENPGCDEVDFEMYMDCDIYDED